ncbi:MAG TPA: SOS response-associated peptidase [Ilumatobacteraceae bacterium]|nr:SOS response-associated peptidase [Ilumatobacteraceae bacterium]
MCGRFVSTAGPDRIAAYFDSVLPTEAVAESLGENYNVAPTQDVYAVVGNGDGTARVDAFHWGLIPSWAKDRKIASRMINARAETLAEKPAFKRLLATKRCIVPMDGFYEWRPGDPDGPVNTKGKPLKQPMFIHRPDGEPLTVAGLWTAWKDPDDPEGRFLHSVTVITTAANATMRPVHDRMPAVLTAERWAAWLDPSNADLASLTEVLDGGPPELLTMQAVSTEVNNVRNNRPELIETVSH